MKLTVITGPKGKLVAIVHAHLSEHDRNRPNNGPHATLRPGPGQKFHEIVAPDEYERLPGEELRRWIQKHLGSKKKKKK